MARVIARVGVRVGVGRHSTCRCAAATVHTLERYARPLRAAAPGGLLPTRFSEGMLTPAGHRVGRSGDRVSSAGEAGPQESFVAKSLGFRASGTQGMSGQFGLSASVQRDLSTGCTPVRRVATRSLRVRMMPPSTAFTV